MYDYCCRCRYNDYCERVDSDFRLRHKENVEFVWAEAVDNGKCRYFKKPNPVRDWLERN